MPANFGAGKEYIETNGAQSLYSNTPYTFSLWVRNRSRRDRFLSWLYSIRDRLLRRKQGAITFYLDGEEAATLPTDGKWHHVVWHYKTDPDTTD